jgi:hypothetical protein
MFSKIESFTSANQKSQNNFGQTSFWPPAFPQVSRPLSRPLAGVYLLISSVAGKQTTTQR